VEKARRLAMNIWDWWVQRLDGMQASTTRDAFLTKGRERTDFWPMSNYGCYLAMKKRSAGEYTLRIEGVPRLPR
jgi:hypothetical protein